ncbi:MAG: hypothetical protein ACJASX_002598, partial [Limisphaerales bacterium]
VAEFIADVKRLLVEAPRDIDVGNIDPRKL